MPNAKRLYRSSASRLLPPIEKLPSELLSSIFGCVTHGSKERSDGMVAPLLLSHISSRWREVALSTGFLWTYITLTYPTSQSQVARTLTWLERSGKYSLDILLDLRDLAWDWQEDSHRVDRGHMESVLRLLLPHVGQWRKCELLSDTWLPIFMFLHHTSQIDCAPKLETITLARCNAFYAARGQRFEPDSMVQPIPLLGGRAPLLRKVSLSGVHVDWRSSGLHNLTELEFKYHSRNVMPSLQTFATILLSCPLLKKLGIIGWGPQFPGEIDAPDDDNVGSQDFHAHPCSIHLPHLTHFSFGFLDLDSALRLLSLFSFPSISCLSIEDVNRTLNLSDEEDCSPLLYWLSQNTDTSPTPSSHPPSHLAPTLPIPSPVEHSLTSRTGASTRLCIPLYQIRELELNGVRATELALAQALAQMGSLTHLQLNDVADEVMGALADASAAGVPVVCPRLQVLHCRWVDAELLLDAVRRRRVVEGCCLSDVELEVNRNGTLPSSETLTHLLVEGVWIFGFDGNNSTSSAESTPTSGFVPIADG